MKISVLVPAFNEESTIKEILLKIHATGLADEIIVVDDGSKDQTLTILSSINRSGAIPNLKIIAKPRNEGKGTAIREGFNHVNGDIVIIQDADLEYNPQDYHALLEPLLTGQTQVVYGSRWLNKEFKLLPLNFFRIGRWLLTVLTNLLYGSRITDEPCGYKIFTTKLIKKIPLNCRKFEFCPEITAKVLRSGYKITEIPITYNPRSLKEGKKIKYSDGIEAIWTLIKYVFWRPPKNHI